jgi:hypothetical protein
MFYKKLSKKHRKLYGNVGHPKLINSLEYSRLFKRFHTISMHATAPFEACNVSVKEFKRCVQFLSHFWV